MRAFLPIEVFISQMLRITMPGKQTRYSKITAVPSCFIVSKRVIIYIFLTLKLWYFCITLIQVPFCEVLQNGDVFSRKIDYGYISHRRTGSA